MAGMVLAAGCGKDKGDGKHAAMPELGAGVPPRVSSISSGSHVVRETFDGSEWKVVEDKTTALSLLSEFNWSGDTLKSISLNGSSFAFTYDDTLRLVKAQSTNAGVYTYRYYPKTDRLEQTDYKAPGTGSLVTKKMIYMWSGEQLTRIKYSCTYDTGDTYLSDITYSLSNGSVFATSEKVTPSWGAPTTHFNYKFKHHTRYLNPLYGLTFCMDPDTGMPYSFQCLNGINRCIPSTIAGPFLDVSIKVINYHSDGCELLLVQHETSDDGTQRTTTELTYEMEFVN